MKSILLSALCLVFLFPDPYNGLSAQQQVCDSLVWNFGVNQFAIDGDNLIADLASKGWDMSFFANNSVNVKITGVTDCPGTFDHNKKLANNRALYLRNYFETAGYPDTRIVECIGIPERGCVRPDQGYNDADRAVSLELCWTKREAAVVVVEPEPVLTPEPSPETPETTALNQITELETGQTLVLDGLNFYPGSHRTLPEAKPVLKKLLDVMKANPALSIEIQGHVCCGKRPDEDGLDDETGEMRLSWNRAKFVYDYLIKNGIEPYRLSYKGYAMTKPLVLPEVTIQDQMKNRRVEVKVLTR